MINHEQKEYLRFKLLNIRRVFIIRDTEYIESIISGVWAVSRPDTSPGNALSAPGS